MSFWNVAKRGDEGDSSDRRDVYVGYFRLGDCIFFSLIEGFCSVTPETFFEMAFSVVFRENRRPRRRRGKTRAEFIRDSKLDIFEIAKFANFARPLLAEDYYADQLGLHAASFDGKNIAPISRLKLVCSAKLSYCD